MVEFIWEECVIVTGLWQGLVASDGRNGLLKLFFYFIDVLLS